MIYSSFFSLFSCFFLVRPRRPGRLIVDFLERLNSISSNLYITRNYRRFPFLRQKCSFSLGDWHVGVGVGIIFAWAFAFYGREEK